MEFGAESCVVSIAATVSTLSGVIDCAEAIGCALHTKVSYPPMNASNTNRRNPRNIVLIPEGQVPYRNSSKRREIQRLGQVFEHLSAESFARIYYAC